MPEGKEKRNLKEMPEENVVTEIEQLCKSRYKVSIDGSFRFVLYRNELKTYRIKEGESIPVETIEQILTAALPKRAKLRCMNLLKSRAYTEYQIREKLRQGFYPETVIEEAVAYIKSFHYIDDERYAENYILYYSESKSRGRIEADLLKKGIDRELIRKAYEKEMAEEDLPEEKSLIQTILEKKHYDSESADYEMKQKMAAFLFRRGFSSDCIWEML